MTLVCARCSHTLGAVKWDDVETRRHLVELHRAVCPNGEEPS